MDQGKVAEFDTPANLLRARGIFYELVNKNKGETADKLTKAAFLAEEQRKKGLKVHVEVE
jgi:hypothetical protein